VSLVWVGQDGYILFKEKEARSEKKISMRKIELC